MSKKRDLEIEERRKFLHYYAEFDVWLTSLGFRSRVWADGIGPNDNHYSFYEKYVNALYGTECYVHDTLNIALNFERDRHEHKYIIVAGIVTGCTKTMTQDEMQKEVYDWVKGEVDKLQSNINKIDLETYNQL